MRRQASKLYGAADKKCVATDEERIGALARKCGKGRLDLSDGAGIKDLELQAEGRGGFLRASQCGVRDCWIARIDQNSNTNALWHQFMQEPQPLRHRLLDEKIAARCVATRSGETGDKTNFNRVVADGEYDWDRRSCSFGRDRGQVAERSDDCHLSADQISQQSWQTIVLAL